MIRSLGFTMRIRSSLCLWLLLFLACFHAAGVGHHVHEGGPDGAVPAASAASDEAPGDSAPGAAHAACTACVLQAHGALPAVSVPTSWQPMALSAAPLPWATREDRLHHAPWRNRFAARDPPAAE